MDALFRATERVPTARLVLFTQGYSSAAARGKGPAVASPPGHSSPRVCRAPTVWLVLFTSGLLFLHCAGQGDSRVAPRRCHKRTGNNFAESHNSCTQHTTRCGGRLFLESLAQGFEQRARVLSVSTTCAFQFATSCNGIEGTE